MGNAVNRDPLAESVLEGAAVRWEGMRATKVGIRSLVALALLLNGCGTLPGIYTEVRSPLIGPKDLRLECRETWSSFWNHFFAEGIPFVPSEYLAGQREYVCRTIKDTS